MGEPLILSPYVKFGIGKDCLYLGFGSLQKIVDSGRAGTLVAAARSWVEPMSALSAFARLRKAGFGEMEAGAAVAFLARENFLIRAGDYDRSDRYSRHALFYALCGEDPSKVQRRLNQSHVVVLGCGGIGNHVACELATAGVGYLTLIDAEIIELSNLTRQMLFTESDLGGSKVEVLAREIRRRASGTQVAIVPAQLREPLDLERIPECDVVAVSADSPGLVHRLNRYAVNHLLPFLNIGYVNDVAAWGPFVIPGRTGCFACQHLTVTDGAAAGPYGPDLDVINGGYQAPSIGPINGLAAGQGALDLLKFLGGFGRIQSLNRRVGIWTHELRLEFQDCSRRMNCDVCGHLP